ncbi:signal peptidase II [Microbacterium aerolatum]|uniref:Lipoprotein signal peptidase n=1 Tax=Microbacterium aerolatum TaxID=153731 RepID=A0A511AIK6_9MICO|nr:signal peptidase II [Microbacterium aerolatum]MCK3770915.1 signal peptidase II [Microbacterium aerolatum]GEK86581.1 lipoprotein signal peptidase [Microbacterium aerolatum]GGB18051.1 lipoprotein signal peptidase [Microbacterium aerolatum]
MTNNKTPRYAFAFIAAGLIVLVDQASKAVALAGLSETERIPLLGDLLGLQLAFNPGAMLSFGSGATWVLTVLGVAVIAALFVAAKRSRTTWYATGIGFVLGGAIGNVLDRLFSPPGFGRGHVTDFLAYGNWFIGNLADVALGIGAVILGVGLWVSHRVTSQEAVSAPTPSETAPMGPS